jgi:hypothetical protein
MHKTESLNGNTGLATSGLAGLVPLKNERVRWTVHASQMEKPRRITDQNDRCLLDFIPMQVLHALDSGGQEMTEHIVHFPLHFTFVIWRPLAMPQMRSGDHGHAPGLEI